VIVFYDFFDLVLEKKSIVLFPLKFQRYIFLSIFFAAILFTVVRYVPLDEERAHKTELVKKNPGETGEESTEDGDPDLDDDENEFLNAPEIFEWSDLYIDPYLYNYTSHKYLCSYVDKITQPPKI
jgi:hypothetical protein